MYYQRMSPVIRKNLPTAPTDDCTWRDPDVVQSVLDRIETSVDPQVASAVTRRKTLAQATAHRFAQSPDAHRHQAYIDTLRNCSQQYAVFSVDGELTVHPLRCRLRACPICAEARNGLWYHKLSQVVKRFTSPKHITLTLRSSNAPLEEQLTKLTSSFRRLRQRKMWKRRSPWGWWTLEITYNADTHTYHPHLHIICNMPFLDKAALSEAWLDITGDSYITSIGKCPKDLVSYICKYISKTSTIWSAPVDPFLLNAALKGRRFAQSFGTFPDLPQQHHPRVIFLGTVHRWLERAAQGDPLALHVARVIQMQAPEALAAALTGAPSYPRF